MEGEQEMSNYERYYRPYWQANREKINTYRRESELGKRASKRYYVKNAGMVSSKNLARYYRKKEELVAFLQLAAITI